MERSVYTGTARILLLLFAIGAIPPQAAGQDPVVSTRYKVHELVSTEVNDRFRILVAVPDGYETSEGKYPAVYVLDAEKSFGLASDATDWLSWAKEMPQVIVVGISYGLDTAAWWQKRSRDLTPTLDSVGTYGRWPRSGGANAFRKALRTEIIPLVEGQYRTEGDRTLVGLSFGGLFGAYDLLQDDALFDRYVLVSPALAWDGELLLGLESIRSTGAGPASVRVYSAVGSEDRPNILEPWQRFNQQVAAREDSKFIYEAEMWPNETHISVFPGALARGLKWVFRQDG
jgi:predicted alpha/beta superfamily hydrolase